LQHTLTQITFSYAIDTGHDQAYYQAFAERSAPYASIIAGAPIMFAISYCAAKKF
jgi:hypothetical protein